ncbi:MAG: nucleotidyltransferase [Nitrospiraceae bacterium]
MTTLERALREIVAFLETQRVSYMVIGGIANLVWGTPRTTVDVDITLKVSDSTRHAFIREVSRSFTVRAKDPDVFVRDTRVLPISSSDGVPIDLMFALLPFEEQALVRAVTKQIGEASARICTAEDLIVHKIISDRPQDRADVLAVIARQKNTLDRAYLDPIVSALSRELARPGIEKFYKQTLG